LPGEHPTRHVIGLVQSVEYITTCMKSLWGAHAHTESHGQCFLVLSLEQMKTITIPLCIIQFFTQPKKRTQMGPRLKGTVEREFRPLDFRLCYKTLKNKTSKNKTPKNKTSSFKMLNFKTSNYKTSKVTKGRITIRRIKKCRKLQKVE
jgi:hypothetical protein